MSIPTSKLSTSRQSGMHQLSERRASILDAAEELFLKNGLENTSMIDIANAAGITKVTLYRYFPDRDPIAFEISDRMLKRIASVSHAVSFFDVSRQEQMLAAFKQVAHAMVRNFYPLRDAYRYIGMFDHLYGDRYPSQDLADWYKEHIFALQMGGIPFEQIVRGFSHGREVVTVMNTIMSFLEKMAARGELMSDEQEVPLDDQLRLFDEMIGVYFDSLMVGLSKSNPAQEE